MADPPVEGRGPEKGVIAMAERFIRRSIGSTLALAAALVLGGSLAHAANNNNVTIGLTSTVAEACTVATSANSATLGDLSASPVTNDTIATITEVCNDPVGYKVTLTSANAGASGNTLYLKGATAGNTNQIDYSLTYNSANVTFASGSGLLTNATAPTPTAGTPKTLQLTSTAGNYNADTYTDTLTITMAAN